MAESISFEEKINTIKSWLGTGSVNIFGLPMSGKDTQGVKLADALGGKFISSGLIIRAMEYETKQSYTHQGALIPTDIFYEWVLPYFDRQENANIPLVLSSIGRWAGEEDEVMKKAASANHEIKAVIILSLSESDVEKRFHEAKALNDRGNRSDDENIEIFHNRLKEFREKTIPVLQHYSSLGLLIDVNGNKTREEVFNEIVEKLYQKASLSHA